MRTLEEKILENQSKSFICPNCNDLVREDFIFCASCGLQVKRECLECKRLLEVIWTQCPYCGTNVGPAVLPIIKEVPVLTARSGRNFFGVIKKIFTPSSKAIEVKRGRGRPRKYPVPTGPVVKRGRGRPRKDETNGQSAKKGPGRPPKSTVASA